MTSIPIPASLFTAMPPLGPWVGEAACGDAAPEDFDPDLRTLGQLKRTAQRFCGGCPVRAQCADYGMSTGQFGVWGGLRFLTTNRPYNLLADPTPLPSPVPVQRREPAPCTAAVPPPTAIVVVGGREVRRAVNEPAHLREWRDQLTDHELRVWHSTYVRTPVADRDETVKAAEREYQRRRTRPSRPARTVPQNSGAA